MRLLVLVAALAPALLTTIAPPLVIGLFAALGIYLVQQRRGGKGLDSAPLPRVTNPSELRTAFAFAALYAVMLFVVAAVKEMVGSKGLTDMDAITLSGLRMFDLQTLTAAQVTGVVVIALTANSVFKLGIVYFAGGGALMRRCVPVIAAMVVGAWIGFGVLQG
jgi:uncharacterized membrane protein (DUF4010 family)